MSEAMPTESRPSALPHDDEAEVAVLGAILLDPDLAWDTARAKLSFSSCFYHARHQILFDTMVALGGDKDKPGIDLVTMRNALVQAGRLEDVGGMAYLSTLVDSVPTAANIEQYAEIVRQNAVLRRLIRASVDTVDRCYRAGDDIGDLIDDIERTVLEITGLSADTRLQTVDRLVMSSVEYLDKLLKGEPDALGIPTGYGKLDEMLTGLRPGEMFVLAARPSIGKTALALNMAANIALRGPRLPVGIFSLEMSSEQLVLRLLCSETPVSVADVREGAMSKSRWVDVMNAGQRLRDSTVVIDDTGAIDLLELRAKARRMKRDYDIRVLFIDYLQLIQAQVGRNATRENEVSRISGHLKSLAKELSIPVVVLAQLNRQAEQTGQRPKLSHLRESGAIEQDADVVALLHRDRDEQVDMDDPHKGVSAEIIIAKHRNGPTGLVELLFRPAYTRFENPSPVRDEDLP